MRIRRNTLVLAITLLCAASCSDAPQKLTRAEVAAEGGASPQMPRELPPNHPPLGASQPPAGQPPAGKAALAGVVEIAGELAGVHRGTIFLVGYDASSGGMALVSKYEHSDFEHAESGESLLRFNLNQQHPTATGSLGNLELEVYFDLDGIVETKEDALARVRVPVQLGDQNVHVRLDDSTRTAAPIPGH